MPEKSSYQPGEPTWIDLATPDMDASVAFYGSLFGWTIERGGEEFGGYSNFSKDGRLVAGLMPLMSPGQPPVWSCYVCVDDADKVAGLVNEAGGMTYAPPMDVGDLGRMAVFADPSGAAFGIWQPGTHRGAGLVREEGTFAWMELSTRNQDAALPLYASAFGWEAARNPGYTEFQLAGTSVAGCMDTPDSVPDVVPSYWMPYFTAADPAAKAEQAAALGARIMVPFTEMNNVAFTIVTDPHGSMFGLLHVTG